MAGEWIKMRTNLWDDPRVAKLCDLTEATEAQIIGGLYWLWAAADEHSEDGIMAGLSLRQIDRKTGILGFGAALCEIHWLADHPEGVRIVKFEEHNGESAKRRCSEAKRKANARNMSAFDADVERTESGQHAELEREEEEEVNLSIPSLRSGMEVIGDVAPDDPPPVPPPKINGKKPGLACPHQEIIALYHELLPDCRHVREWNATRSGYLQQRWHDKASLLHWQHQADGLDWFARFFKFVSESAFLCGRTEGQNGKPPFVASLEWLMRPTNFAKVVEGNFH